MLLDVVAEPLSQPRTCHIETLLSDGEHFSFDLSFTNAIECSGCIGGYTATWQVVFIAVPPVTFDGGFAPFDAN